MGFVPPPPPMSFSDFKDPIIRKRKEEEFKKWENGRQRGHLFAIGAIAIGLIMIVIIFGGIQIRHLLQNSSSAQVVPVEQVERTK